MIIIVTTVAVDVVAGSIYSARAAVQCTSWLSEWLLSAYVGHRLVCD